MERSDFSEHSTKLDNGAPSQSPSAVKHNSEATMEDTANVTEGASPQDKASNVEKSDRIEDESSNITSENSELKKCWICFADETEDSPGTSPWRSPCPCALVAHEKCLLEWIAEVENPKKQGIAPARILCPQCKSPIYLAGRRDPAVEAVKALRRLEAYAALPATVLGAIMTLHSVFNLHGVHTVFMIFGSQDACRILEPVLKFRWYAEESGLRVAAMHILQHWRLHIGLPLITPMLILSRTNLVDSLLTFVPTAFLASQSRASLRTTGALWPPSAAFAVASIPYVRLLYNAYYEKVWSPHERRWLKEIVPEQRSAQEPPAEDVQAPQQQPEAAAEAPVVIEVDELPLDNDAAQGQNPLEQLQMRQAGLPNIGDLVRNNAQRRQEFRQVTIELAALQNNQTHAADTHKGDDRTATNPEVPPLIRQDLEALNTLVESAVQNVNAQDDALQQILENAMANEAIMVDLARQLGDGQREIARVAAMPMPAAPRDPQRGRLILPGLGRLSEVVIGGLLFPTIASISGEVLKYILPRSWTSNPAGNSSQTFSLFGFAGQSQLGGIMQKKWGRSLVGGCLFVVIKDAVMLYVKWKMAVQHRNRRVLNYDKVNKRVAR